MRRINKQTIEKFFSNAFTTPSFAEDMIQTNEGQITMREWCGKELLRMGGRYELREWKGFIAVCRKEK